MTLTMEHCESPQSLSQNDQNQSLAEQETNEKSIGGTILAITFRQQQIGAAYLDQTEHRLTVLYQVYENKSFELVSNCKVFLFNTDSVL